MRLVSRYLIREILTPFVTSLFVLTGILFLLRVLRMIELVVTRNVTFSDIFIAFSYILPRFLEITLPMSLLLSVILAFARLNNDSELIVLRASGMSVRNLLFSLLVFSTGVAALTLVLALWVRPWANDRLGTAIFEIAKNRASTGLVEGVFNEFDQLTVYASQVEDTGSKLRNVIISDERDEARPKTFIARNGIIVSDDIARSLTLQLWEGSIHEGLGSNYSVTYFDVNNLNIGERALIGDESAGTGKKTNELYWGELRSAIASLEAKQNPLGHEDRKRLARYEVELHRRLALPVACFCVALIGMGLGVLSTRSLTKHHLPLHVVLGIVAIVIYYLLLAFVGALAEQGALPFEMIWVPNVLFLSAGVYLFSQLDQVESLCGKLLARL